MTVRARTGCIDKNNIQREQTDFKKEKDEKEKGCDGKKNIMMKREKDGIDRVKRTQENALRNAEK